MNVSLELKMTIELTQRDFATGAAVRKMNTLAQALADLASGEVDDDAAISTISSGLSNTNSSVSTISSGLSDLSTGLSNTNSSVSSISSGLGDINVIPPSGGDLFISVAAGGSNQIDPIANVTKGTLKIDPASVIFVVTAEGEVISDDNKTLTCTNDSNGCTVTYSADPDTGLITVTQSGTFAQLGFSPFYTIADVDGNSTGGNIYTTVTE